MSVPDSQHSPQHLCNGQKQKTLTLQFPGLTAVEGGGISLSPLCQKHSTDMLKNKNYFKILVNVYLLGKENIINFPRDSELANACLQTTQLR